MNKVNKEIAKEIIELVIKDDKRKATLEKALERNFMLTSSYNMEELTLEIYKEGFYLILEGQDVFIKYLQKIMTVS